MQGSTHPGAVTPAGVRDGEPAALEGLCARRGAAVLAFCGEVCEPDAAPRAAAEAFARFRAAVVVLDDLSGVDPDDLLLGATRHAAASLARTPPQTGPRLLGFGGRGRCDACAFIPDMLVARASGALGEADLERLTSHLERCTACREIEAAFARAEHAYREPGDLVVPPDVAESIVAALTAAAPVVEIATPQLEPEFEEPEPEPAIDPEVEAAETVELDVLELEDEPGAAAEPEAWEEEEAQPEAAALPEPATARHAAAAAARPPATPTAIPRTRRHPHVHWPTHVPHVDQGLLRGVILPGAVVCVALVCAMAIAGVFGGTEAAPPTGSAASENPIFPVGSAGAPARGTAAAAAAEIARQAQRAQRRAERARAERLRRQRGAAPGTGATTPTPTAPSPTPAGPSGSAPAARTPGGGTARTRDELDAGRAGGTSGSTPAADPPADIQDPGSYVPGTGGATPPPG
jgi:hypothetical protein